MNNERAKQKCMAYNNTSINGSRTMGVAILWVVSSYLAICSSQPFRRCRWWRCLNKCCKRRWTEQRSCQKNYEREGGL